MAFSPFLLAGPPGRAGRPVAAAAALPEVVYLLTRNLCCSIKGVVKTFPLLLVMSKALPSLRDSGLIVEGRSLTGGTVSGVFNKAGRREQKTHSFGDFFIFEAPSGRVLFWGKKTSKEPSEHISPPSAALSICLNSFSFIC